MNKYMLQKIWARALNIQGYVQIVFCRRNIYYNIMKQNSSTFLVLNDTLWVTARTHTHWRFSMGFGGFFEGGAVGWKEILGKLGRNGNMPLGAGEIPPGRVDQNAWHC